MSNTNKKSLSIGKTNLDLGNVANLSPSDVAKLMAPIEDIIYNDVASALSNNPSSMRWVGKSVKILDQTEGVKEYWWQHGILDADLIPRLTDVYTTITNVDTSIRSDMTSGLSTLRTDLEGELSNVNATLSARIDALPTPMQFKGTLGTGGTATSLPEASQSNNGWEYKVITAGTYQSKTVKIGDCLVSNGSEWIIIPSGDEPSGTVTSVTAGAGLTTTSGGTSDGGTISTSGTINLTKVVTAGSGGSSSNQSPGFGGTASVPYFTFDAYGRITASSNKTITIPNSAATASAAGLMSAADKTIVSGISTGASLPYATASNKGAIRVSVSGDILNIYTA